MWIRTETNKSEIGICYEAASFEAKIYLHCEEVRFSVKHTNFPLNSLFMFNKTSIIYLTEKNYWFSLDSLRN